MIEIDIPGHKSLQLEHLVLDFNGTMACDGHLLPGIKRSLKALTKKLGIHVLTADTFGKAGSELSGISCQLSILPKDHQAQGKLDYVKTLGSGGVVSIGNGRNDRLMLKEAALGIAVVLGEGAAGEAVRAADVVCTDIISALELLTVPLRLVATLRS